MSRQGQIIPLFAAVLVLIWAGTYSRAEETPNFTGDWTLNEGKSEMPRFGRGGGGGRGGGETADSVAEAAAVAVEATVVERVVFGGRGGGMLPSRISVRHDDDTLIFVQEGGRGGSREITLKPGAGAQEVSSPRGTGTIEAKWKGSALEVKQIQERETPRGSFRIEQKTRWSLADDGKTLTAAVTLRTPRGDMDHTLVYDKE